jgi:hypothetical protein
MKFTRSSNAATVKPRRKDKAHAVLVTKGSKEKNNSMPMVGHATRPLSTSLSWLFPVLSLSPWFTVTFMRDYLFLMRACKSYNNVNSRLVFTVRCLFPGRSQVTKWPILLAVTAKGLIVRLALLLRGGHSVLSRTLLLGCVAARHGSLLYRLHCRKGIR